MLTSDALQGATVTMELLSIPPLVDSGKKLLPFISGSRSFTVTFRSQLRVDDRFEVVAWR
jgi:hypothetical protein